ncbi:MAG TPA: ABC transporter ATP-binding protein [Chthoniobacterales bacterium]|nr:ABC transporter ATP-binding protein [Chthoniobacterales bacterium]
MDRAIEVQDLVKTFKRRAQPELRAVDGLSFEVQRGAIFGLLGPNGAGKTTTIRILTTLAQPTSGQARILGHDVVEAPLEVRKRIGVVIQESAAELFLSVRDNLLTFARFHGLSRAGAKRRAETIMEEFGLAPEASRKAQDLSGGFRRRVQVAKMFMVDTPIMFLDEFSTGMDPILKRAVMDRLRTEARNGRTIVLTTQIISEAEELCDEILIVNQGRQIARGDLNALKLLSASVYELSLTFDALPAGIEAELAAHNPIRLHISGNTGEIALKEEEQNLLRLVHELGQRGHVLRVEVSGASLEDIFVELTQRARAAGRNDAS